MAPFRIFVADPQPVVRQALIALLSAGVDLEFCGEASDGPDAVEKIIEFKPDLAILDMKLPSVNGLEVTRQILARVSSQKVIVLTNSSAERQVREIFLAGAQGFIVKENAVRDLLPAIDAMQKGRTCFSVRFAERFLKGYLRGEGLSGQSKASLTEREHDAMQALAREVAASFTHPRRKHESHPLGKYVILAILLIAAVAVAVFAYARRSDQVSSQLDYLLVTLGIKAPPPLVYGGNPETRVWIDVHTALYYCQGSPLYGKTANGRYVKQRDAVLDHFEPAGRKGCN